MLAFGCDDGELPAVRGDANSAHAERPVEGELALSGCLSPSQLRIEAVAPCRNRDTSAQVECVKRLQSGTPLGPGLHRTRGNRGGRKPRSCRATGEEERKRASQEPRS